MRKSLVALVFLASSLLVAQSTSQPSGRSGGSTPAPGTVNAAPQSALVRILTPVANQSSTDTSVLVRWELTNPAADAGEPNFTVQIDGLDPITTTSSEHTFTGLAPGDHSVTVILIDANGTPITGGRAVVQFHVKPATAAPGGMAVAVPPPSELHSAIAASEISPESLSVLSIVGFGVLIGGILSSRKTRH